MDAFDVWLELEATDDNGPSHFLERSVENDGKGPVDKGAHFYRSLQIDANGNPINKRNAWATRSLVYVRLIPPGAADTVHYRHRIPQRCAAAESILKHSLHYRKFAWWNTQFAFAGERAPGTPAATKNYDDGNWVFHRRHIESVREDQSRFRTFRSLRLAESNAHSDSGSSRLAKLRH